MAQGTTTIGTKTSSPPNNTLTAAEFNELNTTVNSNATDAETRIATMEGGSTGILSYTTANLPASVSNQGTIALDTTLGVLVYFKGTAWYKVSDNTFVVDNSGTLWDPSQLATAYWWDASNTGSIVETAGAVSSWTDQNQSAVLAQATALEQPVTNSATINGLNVIDFLGDDDLVGPVLAFAEWTKIVVFSVDGSTFNNTISHVSGSNDAFWENTSGFMNVFQNGNILTSTTALTPGQTILAETTKATNGDTELFMYGNSEGTVNAALGTGAKAIAIGSYNTGFFLNGQIAEVIIQPSVMSLSDRQKAEGYLAHKWGFTANLDAGHPYKSTPPT